MYKVYKPGDKVLIDMDKSFFADTGGEIAEGTIISDDGDTVTISLRCFAYPRGHKMGVHKDVIL